ncbi:MAG TPA: biosynthetic arginine decarboxylase [Xanthomonadaceae bacterium]|nr:biosynthetic arginine decarboxylase [Xanthomonadaceae bacterium]
MDAWNRDRARHTYSIAHWSEGYFDVDESGGISVHPRGPDGPALSLPQAVAKALAQGLRLPLLLRFSDVLHDRLGRLHAAFARAMAEAGYDGGYTAVYPIKVNQHQSVAGELVAAGTEGFGLEAGSKPELMAVLALSQPGGIVVCNGYKDREYIRLALIGRKLGLRTFIVIEKPSELEMVVAEAAALGVQPLLGVRMRLASIGSGKWQNTGGDKAKFGLNPRQLLDLVAQLKAAGMEQALQLLHFHMGSQISNVRDISNGVREAVRYFVELQKLGVAIAYMDVGGGLGVDYEGTRSRSFCSINYSLDHYAATIVQPLAEACAEHGLQAPHVITEAGRAMTAHHAVLVANVSEVEPAPTGRVPPHDDEEPAALAQLRQIHAELQSRPPLELYHEARHYLGEGQQLYAYGGMELRHRARLDDLYYAIVTGVRARLKPEDRLHRPVLDELADKLVDKYFVNFSVFQSIPDVWAIDQVFPIVPIQRLDEAPDRHGVIADLTCDSDGRIDQYVDSEGVDSSLPLHAPRAGESYRLGIFLVGAYQETLGDIHNLFGDTDAVDVRVSDQGWTLANARRGDTADRLLGYVGYDVDTLRAAYAQKLAAAGLPREQAQALRAALEAGLTGYTYLEDVGHAAQEPAP